MPAYDFICIVLLHFS